MYRFFNSLPVLIVCLLVKPAISSQMRPQEEIDITGIVTGIVFHPDSLTGTVEGMPAYKRSAHYEVFLKETYVSLTDTTADDETYFIPDTGYFSLDTILLSPYDTLSELNSGDTIYMSGYRVTGDEWGQSYSYDSLRIGE